MALPETLRSEVTHHVILAGELKDYYDGIDDETLRDTLEGISDLPEMVLQVLRSSLDDDALIGALRARIEDMQTRLSRLKERYERKRELARWAMESGDLPKLQGPDLSCFLRVGPERLEVIDEKQVPDDYLVPVPPRLDRASLLAALKHGEVVSGARLLPGAPGISVRVR
jgi:hypothetical protein